MKSLFIDTSINHEIRVAVIINNKLENFIMEKIDYEYSEKLIMLVDRLLQNVEYEVNQIDNIIVIEGPGRFSALRTGISVANSLAWQLNIPVAALPAINPDDIYWDNVISAINGLNIRANNFIKSILPNYGKEPNITKKKGD